MPLFAFAAWNSYRNLSALTDERLARSLDVQEEEAQKTFRAGRSGVEHRRRPIAGMSDADIRSDGSRLHVVLQKLAGQIPASNRSGFTARMDERWFLRGSTRAPDRDFSDRDFFQAQLKSDAGTYYGQVYKSAFNAQPFFTVSRRLVRDGEFIGVLEISVLPSNFFRFFATLAYAEGQQFALIRNDGVILARYPVAPPGATNRLGENTGFRRTIRAFPAGGSTPRCHRSIMSSVVSPRAASARRRFI